MRVLALFFLSALCLTANAQSLKIGFIDTEQVIASLTQYKNSVNALSREVKTRKRSMSNILVIRILRSGDI
mgnify:CR=1 FL=1